MNVVVVAVAAVVVAVAVVDGLIHSKSGYPAIVQYVSKNYENGYIFPNVIASQNLSMEHNFFQIKVTNI